jgi:hypothetical protein
MQIKSVKNSLVAIAAILILMASGTSCKKSCATTPPEAENGLFARAIFANGSYNITTTGTGGYEYGMKFNVTRNGRVTKLGCKMPNTGSYRVTLWDASVTPQVVIGQTTITQSAKQLLTFNSIGAVGLTTGKDYFISIYSTGAWNYILPSAGGNISYPISTGSVSIKGYQWSSSATGTPIVFPTNNDLTYIAGIPDIEFQAD